jgi:hypothetical protein
MTLLICVGNREDHSIGSRIQSIIASIGAGSIVLSCDAGYADEGKKSRRIHHAECFQRLGKDGEETKNEGGLQSADDYKGTVMLDLPRYVAAASSPGRKARSWPSPTLS